ncbi:MAG: sigma-70 family RNA polymerase sigma factor [Planctomycetes bacterium]|nr:sigma-70 family RNA polymerase sigma factor [Planctomycetota bacterium]
MDARPPLDADALLANAGWVRRLAFGLLGDAAAADDVVQETWMAALRHPEQARHPSWLATVARNLALNRKRSAARRLGRELRVAESAESYPGTGEAVERAEAHRILVEAVLGLPDPYRSAILMRFFDGRRPHEIAASTGLPAATVRTHLARGLAKLRGELRGKLGRDWRGCCVLLLPEPELGALLSPLLLIAMKKLLWLIPVAAVVVLAVVVGSNPATGSKETPRVDAASSALLPEALDQDSEASLNHPQARVPLDLGEGQLGQAVTEPALRLRVADASGNPLAGIPVFPWLRHWGRDDQDRTVRLAGLGTPAPLPAALQWLRLHPPISGVDGLVLIHDPGSLAGGTLDIGGRDYVMTPVPIPGTGLEHGIDLGTVTLERGCRFSGRVVDEAGMPVPNAVVHLLGTERPHVGPQLYGEDPQASYGHHLRTDGEGAFDFLAAPRGRHWVGISTDSHIEQLAGQVELRPEEQVRDHRLVLERAGAVELWVTDAANAPIQRARVSFMRVPQAGNRIGQFFHQVREVDAEGRAVITGLEEGTTVNLTVQASGLPEQRIWSLEPGPLHLVMTPEPIARVLVLNHQGEPVKGATVMSEAAGGRRSPGSTTTGADGFAEVPILEGGISRLTLGLLASPFAEADLDGPILTAPAAPVVLRAPALSQVAVKLDFPVTVPNASSPHLESAGGPFLGGIRWRAAFEEDGWVVFDAVPPGDWTVDCFHRIPGHVVEPRRIHHPGGRTEAVLGCFRPGQLEVLVLGPGGEPLTGVPVELQPMEGETAPQTKAMIFGKPRSNQQGLVVLQDLKPGEYRLIPDCPLPMNPGERILQDDETAGATPLVMIREGEKARIELRLDFGGLRIHVERRGQPCPEAVLRLRPDYQNIVYSRSADGRGILEIAPLRSGTWRIEASAGPGSPTRSIELEVGSGWSEGAINFDGGVVAGQLNWAGGGVVPAAAVWLLAAAPKSIPPRGSGGAQSGEALNWRPVYPGTTVPTDAGGAFRFQDVPAGWFRLLVLHPDAAPQVGGVFEFPAEGELRVPEIVLGRGGAIRLVRPADALPSGPFRLRQDGSTVHWALYDGSRWEYQGLAPGTYQVSWEGNTQDVVVVAGETAEVRFP